MGERRFALCDARMVKSADTADLKSADPYQVVGVQVPLRAPIYVLISRYLDVTKSSCAQNVPDGFGFETKA
jgi:hypothetical protein